MGEIFNRYLLQIGRDQKTWRNTYRDDGTRAFQTAVTLKERAGTRSIVFSKFWYDHKDRVIVSQQSELQESSDYQIIRRTYEYDAAERVVQCTSETLYFPQRVSQIAPLFSSPDEALLGVLKKHGLSVRGLYPREEPVIERPRTRAHETDIWRSSEPVALNTLRLDGPVGSNPLSVSMASLRLPGPK